MTPRNRLALLVPLLLVCWCACNSQKVNPNAPATISGAVSYQGKKLKGGTLTFYAPRGGVYSLPINLDGTYSGTSLPAGEMQVTVETESVKVLAGPLETYGKQETDKNKPVSGTPRTGPMGAASTADIGNYVKIPEQYADKDKSGLTVMLRPGEQTFNIDLTDK